MKNEYVVKGKIFAITKVNTEQGSKVCVTLDSNVEISVFNIQDKTVFNKLTEFLDTGKTITMILRGDK